MCVKCDMIVLAFTYAALAKADTDLPDGIAQLVCVGVNLYCHVIKLHA